MDTKKILIIDDERIVHVFLKAVLEKGGYSVASALDAMQGPMVARQVRPDLIVLDVAMPGGGGRSVFERVRKMSGTADVPVLIYSSIAKEEVLRQIPEAPDVAFVAKPGDPDAILAAVARLLGGDKAIAGGS